MEIRDEATGCFVRLTPVQYAYPYRPGDRFDNNWLVIKGRAGSPDETWTFHSTSLQTDEAADIASWLRAVGEGRAVPMEADNGELKPTVENIEPTIALGLVRANVDTATVRVFLSLEAAPPSLHNDLPVFDFFLDLTVQQQTLRKAADEWQTQLAPFPFRP